MKLATHPVAQKIQAEVERTLQDFGFELVQIKFGGAGAARALTIYMDSPHGVSADDCQNMTRRLSVLLDALDPIPGSYTLIVSSPELDRPLTRESDFDRFAGQLASVRYRLVGESARTIRGALGGLRGDVAIVATDAGPVEVPLSSIEEAHLIYQWDAQEPWSDAYLSGVDSDERRVH